MRIDPVEIFKLSSNKFDYDSLTAKPLFSMLPISIDQYLYTIATRPGRSIEEKYKLIDKAVGDYGFFKIARGTNRSVYRSAIDGTIVIKVGLDKYGAQDARSEFRNQDFIKPFCSKTFEVSPTGIIGLFERVVPIVYKDEFRSVADDVFSMLTKHILNKFIMADIGASFYMNYGLRLGFGPVLLDYPYLYKIDGSKLQCNRTLPSGEVCNGLIDYDATFDFLQCEKCGKKFLATDIAKEEQRGSIISDKIITGRRLDVVSKIIKGGRIIYSSDGKVDPQEQKPKPLAKETHIDYVVRTIGRVATNFKDHGMCSHDHIYNLCLALVLYIRYTDKSVSFTQKLSEVAASLTESILDKWEDEESSPEPYRSTPRVPAQQKQKTPDSSGVSYKPVITDRVPSQEESDAVYNTVDETPTETTVAKDGGHDDPVKKNTIDIPEQSAVYTTYDSIYADARSAF